MTKHDIIIKDERSLEEIAKEARLMEEKLLEYERYLDAKEEVIKTKNENRAWEKEYDLLDEAKKVVKKYLTPNYFQQFFNLFKKEKNSERLQGFYDGLLSHYLDVAEKHNIDTPRDGITTKILTLYIVSGRDEKIETRIKKLTKDSKLQPERVEDYSRRMNRYKTDLTQQIIPYKPGEEVIQAYTERQKGK
jgi:hypothetical protein